MREILTLTKRNMLTYFRDKAAVFFSFLSILILLAIYLLFLGKMFNDLPGISQQQQSVFMVGYVMGGVLVIATITLSLGVIGTYISDVASKKIDAFLVAPVKRYKITLSYYLSTTIITLVLTLLMFVLVWLYLGIIVGFWYSALSLLYIILTLILYVFISTPIMIFVASFIKSMNAFGGVSSIVGTLIGFLSGIYVPLSLLDSVTQSIAGVLPFSHMALNLRSLLIGDQIMNLLTPDILSSTGLSQIQVFGASIPLYLVYIASSMLAVLLLVVSYIKINKKNK